MEPGYPDGSEQDVYVQQRKQDCLLRIHNSTGSAEHCPRVWDGMLCWPPARPGTVITLPCPSYIVGFNPQRVATKVCTEAGDWFFNSGTNATWTNYTQCYTSRMTKVVIRFPELRNSSLIAQYVPLVKTVSRVGYGVSLLTLIVAFCIFATFKKLRCPRNKLHMHLFVSFMMRAFTTLLKDALFVRGVGLPSDLAFWEGEAYFLHENEQNWQCKLIMSLWQYFIMVNYSWILMEGIYLHNLIFLAVFSDTSAITVYVVLGWGLPLLFVMPWVIVRMLWENTLCWTTNNNPNYFLLIKVPTTVSILVNFVLFINIVRLLLSKLMAAISEESRRFRYSVFRVYRRWAKSTLVLVPLFGVHYIVFLIMSYIGVEENVEIVWLFIDQLFTSFQGFLVAILYCILNGEVRSEIGKQWRGLPLWRARAASLPLNMFPHHRHSHPSQGSGSYLARMFGRRHSGRRYGNGCNREKDACATTMMSSVTNDANAGSVSLPHI
ncbi:parathyroid hormone/parathyroid hormone-related peptide receptor-like isoform X1 [Macrosteles quadrilineatus]|uniref:parathyroid hormone/parathyroid hormone-related peptide receptor-like isoform X1 n=2 Tax=Macrosteles quadrilineatus TaxID=74068 RepID=UPI0023E0D1F6|nr:parathyroid hormone/parathyroid hormone-related peptide receptor-like isoform X1 [Macrosteles quadrilineatus]